MSFRIIMVLNANMLRLGKENEETRFEKWCQRRVEAIDIVSGLNDDCISFLELAIKHGCSNLNDLLDQYRFYNNFIEFSGSTTITFKQFTASDANLVKTLTTHITKSKLLESLEEVVQLIEFVNKGKAEEQILSFVCAHSTKNFEVIVEQLQSLLRYFQILYELKKIRPSLLNAENLVQCFICSEVVGDELTRAMRSLGVPSGLVTVVEFCTHIKPEETPTFAEIHSAINDSNKATKLIRQFIHGMAIASLGENKNDDEWWRDLLAKSRQLR